MGRRCGRRRVSAAIAHVAGASCGVSPSWGRAGAAVWTLVVR